MRGRRQIDRVVLISVTTLPLASLCNDGVCVVAVPLFRTSDDTGVLGGRLVLPSGGPPGRLVLPARLGRWSLPGPGSGGWS